MTDGAFDRLAKWWRFAVDRFELQSQEKILGPKNDFPKFVFLGRKKFLCKKSYQYPNSNSPLFGMIVKKHVGSFSQRYWAPKSGKHFRPKNWFSQICVFDRKIFLCKKNYQYPIVTHPYYGGLSKNISKVFHDDIANLARGRKWSFKIGHFWALWPLHKPGMAQNFFQT